MGNENLYCGGGWLNSIYTTGLIAGREAGADDVEPEAEIDGE